MDNTTNRDKEQGFEDLQLFSRFLMGLLIVGSDELVQRLRELQEQIEAESTVVDQGVTTGDESAWDLARHMAVGLLVRGQKRITRGIYNGVLFSLGTANWAAGKLNRWTDNRLMRPLRQPVESRWRRLKQQAGLLVDEGRLAGQNNRLLATRTVEEILHDIIGAVSQDPELARLVLEAVQAQTTGLTEVVADNARQVAVAGDDAVEGVARRLLRREPRSALRPSPFLGKPQTMYRDKIQK